MSLTLNIQGTASSTTGFGSLSVGPFSATGSIPPQVVNLVLASGNNTIAVPASSVGCIITPPVANGVVIKAKTTLGDTGINVPQATPSILLFDTANLPTNLYLNAASLTTGQTQVVFF